MYLLYVCVHIHSCVRKDTKCVLLYSASIHTTYVHGVHTCICVYVYISYVRMYIHIRIRTYEHTYVHTYIHTCFTYVLMCIFACCTTVLIYMCVCSFTCHLLNTCSLPCVTNLWWTSPIPGPVVPSSTSQAMMSSS